MINQGKNIIIGLFVLAALGILIFILLYLRPSVGDNGQTFFVRFDNIDKVSIGTRVSLGGKAVGEVVDIREVPEARMELRRNPNAPVYIYELTIKVDSHIKIYNTDVFSISTSGLLGEKSIEITPEPPLPAIPLVPLTSSVIIYAEPSPSVEDAIREFKVIGSKVDAVLDNLNGQLVEIEQRKVWENLASIMKNFSEISKALNQPKELTGIVTNLHGFSEGINDLQVKVHQAWPKVEGAIDKFNHSSENIYAATDRIKRGEGSIGRLVANDESYLQLHSVLSKADVLMDDINHYGLLFQNDKHWQRLRARRVNLLSQLSSPQEFRNFFNDEVAQISTSLSRVSMVLNETENSCVSDDILSDRDFEKVFAELLRRVKGLEENLNLYNQQAEEVRERNAAAIWLSDICIPVTTCEGSHLVPTCCESASCQQMRPEISAEPMPIECVQ